jgi:plasmid stability protein
MKKVTVIFDDDDLYTALKVQAARSNRPLKALITDALEAWLEAEEELEDASAYREAMAEHREKGGVPWEDVRARARALLVERRQSSGAPRTAKAKAG